MKELIAPESAEKAFLFLAVAGPLVGLILGTMIGAHEKCAWPRMLGGALIGAVGTVVWGMWRLYNATTNLLGLDSVLNLVLEITIFMVVGALIGAAAYKTSRFLKRRNTGG